VPAGDLPVAGILPQVHNAQRGADVEYRQRFEKID
jgi:hypothetical protein